MPRESHNEFKQSGGQSNEQFLCKNTKLFDQSEAKKCQEFSEPWPKVKQHHNEFSHYVWVNTDQQFVCKCIKTSEL